MWERLLSFGQKCDACPSSVQELEGDEEAEEEDDADASLKVSCSGAAQTRALCAEHAHAHTGEEPGVAPLPSG